jgi:quercetin dioxygenase-like cupin family protein
MTFHRFEDFTSNLLTPHLSSARGPVIEGSYMYFCLVRKEPGTGSELHYHPNELLIFPLSGKFNIIVGKDRRVIAPGTFVHVPAYARHSVKATEEGPAQYLYMKDKTWTVVGLAADEAVPDKAMSVEEVNRLYGSGRLATRTSEPERSKVIIEGLNTCFYPMHGAFDGSVSSARSVKWVEGQRMAFGLFEVPGGYREASRRSPHELFVYVLDGAVDAEVNGAKKTMKTGDIAHVRRGETCRFSNETQKVARYAVLCSTPWLEDRIDSMTPAEVEQAQLQMKPN